MGCVCHRGKEFTGEKGVGVLDLFVSSTFVMLKLCFVKNFLKPKMKLPAMNNLRKFTF